MTSCFEMLIDYCKHSSVNQMAAGSRPVMEFICFSNILPIRVLRDKSLSRIL